MGAGEAVQHAWVPRGSTSPTARAEISVRSALRLVITPGGGEPSGKRWPEQRQHLENPPPLLPIHTETAACDPPPPSVISINNSPKFLIHQVQEVPGKCGKRPVGHLWCQQKDLKTEDENPHSTNTQFTTEERASPSSSSPPPPRFYSAFTISTKRFGRSCQLSTSTTERLWGGGRRGTP